MVIVHIWTGPQWSCYPDYQDKIPILSLKSAKGSCVKMLLSTYNRWSAVLLSIYFYVLDTKMVDHPLSGVPSRHRASLCPCSFQAFISFPSPGIVLVSQSARVFPCMSLTFPFPPPREVCSRSSQISASGETLQLLQMLKC